MEEFDWRGRRLRHWVSSGVVLSTEKSNELHISSTGASVVHHGPYTSTVTAPTVSSRNVIKHEFWYRNDFDGSEVAVKLSGIDIPLREGQAIDLVYVSRAGSDQGWQAALVNRTANRHWFLTTATALDKSARLGRWASKDDLPDIVACAGGGLVLFVLASMVGAVQAWFLFVCIAVATLVVLTYRAKQRRASLLAWLEKCAQECYGASLAVRRESTAIRHEQVIPVTINDRQVQRQPPVGPASV